MKIVSAVFMVRLEEDDDLEAVGRLDDALMDIGFDSQVEISSVPQQQADIIEISFMPAKDSDFK